MNQFLEAMDVKENEVFTENGAKTNKSTKCYCLDLFAIGSSARNLNQLDVERLIINAYNENPKKCMKILFHIRDIREGSGEREFFKKAMNILIQYGKHESINKNIEHIPFFGRWDDLYTFSETGLWEKVISMFREQLEADLYGMTIGSPISLLGKWLKSENASSKETIRLAKLTYKDLGYTSKEYRKTLSKLRKYIDIVETHISKKKYNNIDYSKVPSRALYKYRNAFKTNDNKRYDDFLNKANDGDVNINTTNIYPHELVRKYLNYYESNIDKSVETMWNNLPDFTGSNSKNAICVCDVSGSMSMNGGIPLEVSIALGIYFSERNNGDFKNRFITFSEKPSIVKITGKTLLDKVRMMNYADWGYSTNISATFDLILKLGIDNEIPQKDMPEILYIISDMEFNKADSGNTNFENIKEKYKKSGYEMPTLVFWNVNARQIQHPTVMNDKAILVSGFSPSVFNTVVCGLSAIEYMDSVVESERYSLISV